MSGAAFEGLPLEVAREMEQYTPGSDTHDEQLMAQFFEYYDAASGWISGPHAVNYQSRFIADLADMLKPYADDRDFDANGFLDAVAMRAGLTGALGEDTDYVLVSLISALHQLGHNGFVLDLCGCRDQCPDRDEEEYLLFDHDLYSLGLGLRGTAGNPLRVTYRNVSAETLGRYALQAIIRHEGEADEVGYAATYSSFTVLGKVELAGIAKEASYCEFYLNPLNINFFVGGNDSSNLADEDRERHIIQDLRRNDFFRNKNLLYFPDGSGGWRRVKP